MCKFRNNYSQFNQAFLAVVRTFELLFCVYSLFIFSSCAVKVETNFQKESSSSNSSSSQSSSPSCPSTSVTVTAAYSAAPDWNDYIEANESKFYEHVDSPAGVVGVGNLCNGDNIIDGGTKNTQNGQGKACVHAGEVRKVELPTETSCANLTISDALEVFNWTCVDSGTHVIFYSHALKSTKGLSHLLKVDGTDWENNAVTIAIEGSCHTYKSAAGKWWGNPVRNLNSLDNVSTGSDSASEIGIDGVFGVNNANTDTPGGTLQTYRLDDDGVIWTITTNKSVVGFNMNGNKQSLVVYPEVTLSYTNAGVNCNATGEVSNANRVLVCSGTQQYIWVEGNFNGGALVAGKSVMYFRSADFIKFYRMKVSGGESTLLINAVNNSELNQITLASATNCLYFGTDGQSNFNKFSQMTMSNCNYGIWTGLGNNNVFTQVTMTNLASSGFNSNNTIRSVFIGLTTTNSAYGLNVGHAGSNSTFHQAIFSNMSVASMFSGGQGLYFYDVAITHSALGISFNHNADGSRFYGKLLIGGNTTNDCSIDAGSGGLNISTGTGACSEADANLDMITGIDLTTSFHGLTVTEASNTHETLINSGSGVVAFNTPITDWVNFSTQFRAWGKYVANNNPMNSVNRLRCVAGNNCGIWDWALSASDVGNAGTPALLGVLSCPTGNSTRTQTWTTGSATYLMHAIEITADGIGDDDLLCESNETCLYAPNIGSYQGHGELVSASIVSGCLDIGIGGTIVNVKLLQYEGRGY